MGIKMLAYSLQIIAAWLLPILDYDEVFNSWEYLYKVQYGINRQVWRNSPDYAFRSYFYIFLHYLPASLLKSYPKPVVFKLMRVFLSLFSIFSQETLRKSLELPDVYSVVFSISPGFLIAGHAFLPFTFSTNCLMLFYACFMQFYKSESKEYLFAAFLACFTAVIIGWPFFGVIFAVFIIPYLLKNPMILSRPIIYRFGIAALAVVFIPSFLFDTTYYKKLWKSLFYSRNLEKNIVSSELFNLESWQFYFNSLLLNFNFVIIIQLYVLFLLFPAYLVYAYRSRKYVKHFLFYFSLWFSSLFWLILVCTQQHKDERFLYIIYPGIAILSTYLLENLGKCGKFALICVLIVSFSRIYSIYDGFSAPLKIWQDAPGNVCVGSDLHLFPSSYNFNHHLFYSQDKLSELLSREFQENFMISNKNSEKIDNYVEISHCRYVILLETEDRPLRTEFQGWEVIQEEQFLDGKTSQPFRSFYLPEGKRVYGRYLLIENRTMKIKELE
jgi:alpha-1,2-mannosyltransferase